MHVVAAQHKFHMFTADVYYLWLLHFFLPILSEMVTETQGSDTDVPFRAEYSSLLFLLYKPVVGLCVNRHLLEKEGCLIRCPVSRLSTKFSPRVYALPSHS